MIDQLREKSFYSINFLLKTINQYFKERSYQKTFIKNHKKSQYSDWDL